MRTFKVNVVGQMFCSRCVNKRPGRHMVVSKSGVSIEKACPKLQRSLTSRNVFGLRRDIYCALGQFMGVLELLRYVFYFTT